MKRKICILGSTGSIGVQALEVIRHNASKFEVVGLASTGRNKKIFFKQISEFRPGFVATLRKMPDLNGQDFKYIYGEDANERLVVECDADVYLIAISGISGVRPSYIAASKGKILALANKESLVSAGMFIIEQARKSKTSIVPVDSEHSAIFQCLMGQSMSSVKRIILTATGGPFLRTPVEDLDKVKPKDALAHPVWDMGPKVTVDSATMMNKGLEIIEARWLFDLPPSMIDVVIHPQGVVHSMVEFMDGSVLAQMGSADMKIPISFAIGYPERVESKASFLDFSKLNITFEPPDYNRFPLLALAYKALEKETVLPVVLNAADEIAVYAFLDGKIKFTDISRVIEKVVNRFEDWEVSSIDDVIVLQKEALIYSIEIVKQISG